MSAAGAPSGGSTARTVASAAGVIAAITLLARIVGFGRWFAFSHAVGATCVGSVYQSVNAVPNVLFEIAAGGVLAAVAVPLVATALARGEHADADRVASALLTWALVVLVPLGGLVALAARPIATSLLGTGCEGDVELGTQMLRVFAIQVPLYGVAIVLAGVLQAHHRFVAAALAPLLSSLVVIASYLLYRGMVADPAAGIPLIPSSATTVLAVGTTLGVVALGLPLLIPARRARIRLRPALAFPPGTGRRVRALALAGLVAVAGQQLATLVVIRLANDRGGAGTLNVFTYAQAVTLLPYAVLAVPIATAAFPSLARAHAVQSGDESGQTASTRAGATDGLRRAWFATLVVSLSGAAGLVAVAIPVGSFFAALDAGAADDASSETLAAMSDAVSLFAPAVIGLGVIGLLTRASYVRGKALLAGVLAATGWLASVGIPALLLDAHGAGGPTTLRALSAGASIGLGLGAGLLTVLVGRTWGWSALALPLRPFTAAVTGALVAAVAGRAASSWLSPTGAAGHQLGASLALGLGVGAGALVLMVGTALLVDPSLARRMRRIRSTEGRSR